MTASRTGYTVKGGTRTRETFHESRRIAGYTITLWRTGNTYTIEHTDAAGALTRALPGWHDERKARDLFEGAVTNHYTCVECGDALQGASGNHRCPARD